MFWHSVFCFFVFFSPWFFISPSASSHWLTPQNGPPKGVTGNDHKSGFILSLTSLGKDWEVLHGVSADGVGVKFAIFAVNCSHLPLSSRRVRKKKKKQRKKKTKKNEKKRPEKQEKQRKTKKKMRETESFIRPHLHQPHEEPSKWKEWGSELSAGLVAAQLPKASSACGFLRGQGGGFLHSVKTKRPQKFIQYRNAGFGWSISWHVWPSFLPLHQP